MHVSLASVSNNPLLILSKHTVVNMSQVTERTRLLSDETKPQYVFDSSIARERKRRVRQFQCCLCAILICVFVVAIVVIVAYSISSATTPSDDNSTSDSLLIPSQTITILLTNSYPIPDKNQSNTVMTDNLSDWNNAMAAGQRALQDRDNIEKKIKPLPEHSPSYRHQKATATSEKARNLTRIGYQEEYATRYILQQSPDFNITRICNRNQTNVTFSEYCTVIGSDCNVFQKYRTYNGSCNNLKHPRHYGVAYRPFRRHLPPDYADGISKPRVSQSGDPLPSARTVSLEVHRPYFKDDNKFSVVLAVFGQFLDHDITATALNKGVNGSSISCCLDNQPNHPECFSVKLDYFDPYTKYNVSCIEFMRSAPAPTCCLGPRQQLNQITSFIDASVIYSADEDFSRRLRKFQGGELEMFVTEDNRTLLPLSKDVNDGCNRVQEYEQGRYCFLAGDDRVNENLHLTSMQLIWARQHNAVAQNLAELNPNWDDERIFQEARKIIGAQMQHISYNEFLKVLLGDQIMEKFDLYPQKSGYFHKYNDSIDPSIANSFASAAFRFAHSIIPGLMKSLANDSSSPEYVQLHTLLFDPFKLYQSGELDKALRGASDTSIQASDPFFSEELKSHLFQDDSDKKSKVCGLDLVSLNIQRGRDHGLAGYNSWREHCGLRRVHTFKQLQGDIDDDSLRNILSVYRNVEDIDLYTGAVSEKPLNGSILGPTLTCLILDQFMRIKYGDRFWYENSNVFTQSQLDEIRKTTLAKILCENADSLTDVQPYVMEKVRKADNPLKPCQELAKPNFKPWQEKLPHVQTANQAILVKINP